MKGRWVPRLILYGIFALCMVGSAIFLGRPTGVAALECCAYGIDCTQPGGKDPGTEVLCCFPMSGQADCAPERPNYCKTAC